MIIANPIYDVTFKRLLENDRAAKFLISTILDCEVISLEPAIQEHTYKDEETGKISLFRMDFAATIKTKDEGERRVIIELQKALLLGDIYRFRKYLGSEYVLSKLPIISIYILGFDLSVDSPAFVARPDCWDLRTREKLAVKDDFVEHLTHRAYFVQALRIKPGYNTKLEKLLSIFEQANFIGSSKTTKEFPLTDIDPELREVVNILQYVAADKEARNELDREEYYHQAMEGMFGEKDRELAKNKETIERQGKELAEKDQELAGKDQELAGKDQELAEALQRNKDIAKELKHDGMPLEKISKLTGLSTKEIEKL